MRASRFPAFCLLVLLASAAGGQAQQTQYVSDRFEVLLRTGTSTQHAIIKALLSGTRVEVLENDPDSGYSKVRTADGLEGWVLNRYLMDQPAARDQLAAANARVEALNARVNELNARLAELGGERDSLDAERNGLASEAEAQRVELDQIRRASASALELDRDNRQLRTQLAAAEKTADSLRAEVAELKANTRRDWFLAGAGVLAAGLILGLVLPNLKLRRKSRWGQL